MQVWSTPQTRTSPNALAQLLIDTPSGTRVKLGDVADVKLVPTPNSIKHENTKRHIDVTASTDEEDLAKVVAALQPRLAGVQYPVGVHAELLGEYQERAASARTGSCCWPSVRSRPSSCCCRRRSARPVWPR